MVHEPDININHVFSIESKEEGYRVLEIILLKSAPRSDRRTIKGWTVFEIKVFAATIRPISNKNSAAEK